MKDVFSIIFLVIFAGSLATAQTIRNDVTASGGDYAASGNIVMEYTIGEPATETLNGTNLIMTQGFHQPLLVVTSVDEYDHFSDVNVFPNPTSDKLCIDIPSQNDNAFDYSLYNNNGKLIGSESLTSGKNAITLKSYAPGMYVLKIQNNKSGQVSSYKISKSGK